MGHEHMDSSNRLHPVRILSQNEKSPQHRPSDVGPVPRQALTSSRKYWARLASQFSGKSKIFSGLDCGMAQSETGGDQPKDRRLPFGKGDVSKSSGRGMEKLS